MAPLTRWSRTSAQTNGDRGRSDGAGCRRHRGARAGSERRLAGDAAHDLGSAADLDRDDVPGDDRAVLAGDDLARTAVDDDRDDVANPHEAGPPVDHAAAAADVDRDHSAGDDEADVPADDLDPADPHDVAFAHDVAGPVRSHR